MKRALFISLLAIQSAIPRISAQQPFKPAFACKEDDLQWAGMTCSEQEHCPVYLEVFAVYPVGAKLFVTGNIHADQSTLYSILLETDDAGASWREPVERIRGAELDAIQFVTPETGWVSGQRVYPNAGDPFFLITSDGGKSWRKSDVLPDGSDGAIQSFWFDSPRTGKLALDRGASTDEQMRYALYETMTGGDSWSVRETSEKPLQAIPKAQSPERAIWRARGDSAHKLLILEEQNAGAWKAKGALTLELTRCTGEAAKP